MYAQPKVNLISIDTSIIDRITSITDKLHYKIKSFKSGIDFYNNYDKSKNSCTIVNIKTPNGFIDIIPSLKETTAPFIFLSLFTDTKIISRAFKSGAFEFMDCSDLESLMPSTLVEGIQLDIIKKKQIIESTCAIELLELLSPKEQEVLSLLIKGFCHKKIAKLLNISFRTVETHLSHIKLKTKIPTSELIYIITPILR